MESETHCREQLTGQGTRCEKSSSAEKEVDTCDEASKLITTPDTTAVDCNRLSLWVKLVRCWLIISVVLVLVYVVCLYLETSATVDSALLAILGSELKLTLSAYPLYLWSFLNQSAVPYQPASEQQDGKKTKRVYAKADISNREDRKIRDQLDLADAALDRGDVNAAMASFEHLLARYPRSPRAVFGKARALNALAEQKQSNKILEQAIDTCMQVLALENVPKALLLTAGKMCAERQSFRGYSGKAVETLRKLVRLYPEEVDVWNDLGVKLLLNRNNEEARESFKQALRLDERNGFALVHLGFIVKTTDRDYEASIPLLRDGIMSNAPGVIDGRFFFHLGDALYRTGRHSEAYDVYGQAADYGLFPSAWQRSLYNVDNLTARPWWTLEQTGNADQLKRIAEHWTEIRDEGVSLLNEQGLFEKENEDLSDVGDWRQFTLYMRGRRSEMNCRRAPRTCSLFEQFTEATSCTRGQIKFSVMQPGVHVWPHCGPTNCRLRAHLGLVVPPGPRIRVGNDTKTWKLGEFIVLDDSIDHEVWHDGSSFRLILIVDMWHPEVTVEQRNTLSPI